MIYEPVQVTARWRSEGSFEPAQFVWQNRTYPVKSTGRSWEDEQGLHVLCMADGSRVFELVFRLQPAGWLLKPPDNQAKLA